MCLWHFVKGNCSRYPDCRFSHSDQITVTAEETKMCAAEMVRRFPSLGGTGVGIGKGKGRARSETPGPKMQKDKDGNTLCRHWAKDKKCSYGDNCKFSHAEPA